MSWNSWSLKLIIVFAWLMAVDMSVWMSFSFAMNISANTLEQATALDKSDVHSSLSCTAAWLFWIGSSRLPGKCHCSKSQAPTILWSELSASISRLHNALWSDCLKPAFLYKSGFALSRASMPMSCSRPAKNAQSFEVFPRRWIIFWHNMADASERFQYRL